MGVVLQVSSRQQHSHLKPRLLAPGAGKAHADATLSSVAGNNGQASIACAPGKGRDGGKKVEQRASARVKGRWRAASECEAAVMRRLNSWRSLTYILTFLVHRWHMNLGSTASAPKQAKQKRGLQGSWWQTEQRCTPAAKGRQSALAATPGGQRPPSHFVQPCAERAVLCLRSSLSSASFVLSPSENGDSAAFNASASANASPTAIPLPCTMPGNGRSLYSFTAANFAVRSASISLSPVMS